VNAAVLIASLVNGSAWRPEWTYMLWAAAAMTVVLVAMRLRSRFYEQRTRDLEALVTARTTELALANEALRNLSLTDPLTGLHNRRFVDATMNEVVARTLRRHTMDPRTAEDPRTLNRDMVFLMVDLDFFKPVNDRYGHRSGDLVLQQTATILRDAVREVDRVVRWGGEEFLVMAIDASLAEAPMMAERIRSRMAAHTFDIGDGRELRLSCSVGFACFPVLYMDPGCYSWEQVLNLADQCLYEAKEAGRNRWVGIIPLDDAEPTLSIHPLHMGAADLVNRGIVERKSGPSEAS
jgi:diguanylate cyclase (GGDEF)-like protein